MRVGGNFTLAPAFPPSESCVAAPHVLLVAGGVGINPLYSMLLQLAATGSGSAHAAAQLDSVATLANQSSVPYVTLIWSVRTLREAFLLPQLRALSHSVDGGGSALAGRLRLVVTITRQNLGDQAPEASGVSCGSDHAEVCHVTSNVGVSDTPGAIMHDDASHITGDVSDVLVRCGRVTPALLQRLSTAPASCSTSTFGGSSHGPDARSAAHGHSFPDARLSSSNHAFVCGPPCMTESAPRTCSA